MMFVSTAGEAPPVGLSTAIRLGAAPDGGLFMPRALPPLATAPGDSAHGLATFAGRMLAPFFTGDPLEPALGDICASAFDFPVPLVTPDAGRPNLRVLELFHGPTGAFKDLGARFLALCLDRLGDPAAPLTILAATSGDTGGAVGCAVEGRRSVQAAILFPRGRVSPFQELQLTCWGPPVRAIEVDGDFDDCQRLVKAAFADRALQDRHRLTSANSINIGRLLPQAAYCAFAADRLFQSEGIAPGFIVPSGNLGHGLAVLLARAMGSPIGPLVLATNANRTLDDWHRTGRYRARPSVATLANAMDIGAPNNFERLVAMPAEQRELRVERVDDAAIVERVRLEHERSGYVWCPHSATAAEALERLPDEEKAERPWILAATAHPFKFAGAIEPIIGRSIDPPPALAAILGRPVHKTRIEPRLEALADRLEEPAPA